MCLEATEEVGQIEQVDKSSVPVAEPRATQQQQKHSYVHDFGSRAYDTVSFLKNQVPFPPCKHGRQSIRFTSQKYQHASRLASQQVVLVTPQHLRRSERYTQDARLGAAIILKGKGLLRCYGLDERRVSP
jgi:hypothetical protein